MLRDHKPPPIRSIWISDFGLPDPKRDPDRHQNCITWSSSHALPLQKILSKSVHKFASNPTDRQTNRQTDRTKNITSFFGGGNDYEVRVALAMSYRAAKTAGRYHWVIFFIGYHWSLGCIVPEISGSEQSASSASSVRADGENVLVFTSELSHIRKIASHFPCIQFNR